ncbi:MAG: proteasome regulatory particle base subunit [Chrysothrix sp. TS-e1954]|nr:MAG: proteasome regulatory particle base subunit [Chrysothrix sp. TS-e1954]
MAGGEDTKPSASEKGKGKAPAEDGTAGANGHAEPQKDKDGKVIKDGKDSDKPAQEELSEEDQQLKGELEMLVERLQESNTDLYKPAIEAIKNLIKTSTSSVTAVPKPLKFLRPHYEQLEKTYESWPAGDNKTSLADMLSVLAMTSTSEDKPDLLKYRLLAPTDDLGQWGHEYTRHLALECMDEYHRRLVTETQDDAFEPVWDIARRLSSYFLKHNAEADAVDLLSDVEIIDEIEHMVDEDTYDRVCRYMVSMVPLLTYPDNDKALMSAHFIYKRFGKLSQAMSIAIRLNNMNQIKEDLLQTEDKALRRQMAFQIARQRIWLDLEDDEANDDETLVECLSNTHLSDHYKTLGKELNILDPKSTQDIYKTHLESSRTAGLTNVDSARHNLASAFVNAFVNAGFGNDKMMLGEEDTETGKSWVWKTKDDGMISAAASVGMLQQWDLDNGLQIIDRYSNVNDDNVKAGAMLAVGILNCGVREASEPAMALLSSPDVLNHKKKELRVTAIMGLGLAYAGTCKDDMLVTLLPYVSDTSLDMQISAMAALSLGMIFIGSANSDISEAILETFFDNDREKQLKDKWTRFMVLGLALLFFNKQDEVDIILDTLEAVQHPMSEPSSVLCSICAWAGTGTVLKLQDLLHICNEHIDDDASPSPPDGAAAAATDNATNNNNNTNTNTTSSGSTTDSVSPEQRRSKINVDEPGSSLLQSYAVIGLGLISMGEDIGQEMILRQFGHLMHYGEANIRRAVPLAMGLVSPSNPQMKVYDTLSRYSHDNDPDVAVNSIFAMGLLGAGTNNARLAQLLRQLASYYSRDANALFMVRIAQGLLHMGKGTLTVNPFHTDRSIMSRVAAAGLLTTLVALLEPKQFILGDSHYLLYFLATAMQPRMLVTLDEETLKPLQVNVRVGQAVDTVGQAGKPKTITGWQTQSTPVVLAYGERAELEDEKYMSLSSALEGLVILRKNPDWED